MAESQTVVILKAKREEIAAAIENYECELERARADFAHITAALAIFDADDKPGSQRPYTHLVRGFRYGEIAAWCRQKLAEGRLSTPELARHVMKPPTGTPSMRLTIPSASIILRRTAPAKAARTWRKASLFAECVKPVPASTPVHGLWISVATAPKAASQADLGSGLID
jgi:hypothetical protein